MEYASTDDSAQRKENVKSTENKKALFYTSFDVLLERTLVADLS